MSTAGHAESRYGRWPDDDQPRRGRRAAGRMRRAAGAGRRRRGGRGGERAMVPEAEFTSYYGRPVVKASPWQADIPAYLFTGGLAGASSLLAAGAELSGRRALARNSRISALLSIGASTYFLIHDLGRPSRFLNMLRVFRPTSPMSMGSWILFAYGPAAGLAATAEAVAALPAGARNALPDVATTGLRLAARPAGLLAAVTGSAVATYTAVLLGDTATPAWHEASGQLPFVFAGSAASAAGGLAMLTSPRHEAAPARRMAVGGVAAELAAYTWMRRSMGLSARTLGEGRPGAMLRAAAVTSSIGALGTVLGRRSRPVAMASGVALLVGSALTRFGIFEAGQASARDPKYTVVPQRERVDAGRQVRHTTDGS